MLSPAVSQDTSHTYKNLEYDLGHLWSAIAQWLEHRRVFWKVMGLTLVGGPKVFFRVFLLENASPSLKLFTGHSI